MQKEAWCRLVPSGGGSARGHPFAGSFWQMDDETYRLVVRLLATAQTGNRDGGDNPCHRVSPLEILDQHCFLREPGGFNAKSRSESWAKRRGMY